MFSVSVNLPSSSFDAVHYVEPINISQVDLPCTLHVLKPSGVLYANYLLVSASGQTEPSLDLVQSALKLNGFIQIVAVVSINCMLPL